MTVVTYMATASLEGGLKDTSSELFESITLSADTLFSGNHVSLIHFLFRNNLSTDVTKFAHTSGKFPIESEAFVTNR